jgi:hypothetical protein
MYGGIPGIHVPACGRVRTSIRARNALFNMAIVFSSTNNKQSLISTNENSILPSDTNHVLLESHGMIRQNSAFAVAIHYHSIQAMG